MNEVESIKQSIFFCRKRGKEYLARIEELENKAKNCKPKSRGGYLSHAKQRRDDAARMKANETAMMGRLVEIDYALYLELVEGENG